MSRLSFAALLFLVVPVLLAPAAAEVVDVADHGFSSRNVLTVALPPAEVFAALVQDVGE